MKSIIALKFSLTLSALIILNVVSVYAQLAAPPIPGRPDNLTQADVDKLLANGNLNFDGLRFENKRMEFINFDKGSFRGTTFYNTKLDMGVARRKAALPDRFDFEDANFIASRLKDVHLSHWKFNRVVLQVDSIVNSSFTTCPFSAMKAYACTFIQTKFNNSSRATFDNVELISCNFEGGRIDSLRYAAGIISGNTVFTGTVFSNVEFFNLGFLKNGVGSSLFKACNFFNVKFTSCTLNSVVFDLPELKCWFENVTFENSDWRLGKVNASFNGTTQFKGAAMNLQGVDFAGSFFNGCTFGIKNSSFWMPVKGCKFSVCQFDGTVFYNCDFENSTFPTVSVLQAAGVKFFNCKNAPYSS